MFNLTLNNVKILKDSIETISQIIDEGIFKIKRDGIELLATDRAMVAVVDFRIDASAFDEYKCEKETEIGLNMLNFLALLKRAGSEDKLKMNLGDNRLNITLEGRSIRNFSIPLLNINSDEIPPVNQLDFNASAELSTAILDQGISDADIIADSVIIELLPEQLKMLATGDTSKSELILSKGNSALINLDVKDNVKSRYPLDYLKKIIKASRIADTVKISLGTDYPMKLEFKGDNVSLNMVLAPRVSEE
ncbi:MAG: proliferating cell nuclear antigen (pcna) [Candidatus Aenigmarchaeota archaeon]|nr:proliferating cell nuclear antigen (pcna) [Candidatus Aenigmarchaeota archaeon]